MKTGLAELRDLYQELILDHGRHPHNFRKMANANREALGNNPLCGDKVTVYLHLSEHDAKIEDVSKVTLDRGTGAEVILFDLA